MSKCLNSHEVSLGDAFCAQCGVSVNQEEWDHHIDGQEELDPNFDPELALETTRTWLDQASWIPEEFKDPPTWHVITKINLWSNEQTDNNSYSSIALEHASQMIVNLWGKIPDLAPELGIGLAYKLVQVEEKLGRKISPISMTLLNSVSEVDNPVIRMITICELAVQFSRNSEIQYFARAFHLFSSESEILIGFLNDKTDGIFENRVTDYNSIENIINVVKHLQGSENLLNLTRLRSALKENDYDTARIIFENRNPSILSRYLPDLPDSEFLIRDSFYGILASLELALYEERHELKLSELISSKEWSNLAFLRAGATRGPWWNPRDLKVAFFVQYIFDLVGRNSQAPDAKLLEMNPLMHLRSCMVSRVLSRYGSEMNSEGIPSRVEDREGALGLCWPWYESMFAASDFN